MGTYYHYGGGVASTDLSYGGGIAIVRPGNGATSSTC
jgi:hypothetical protein